MVYKKNDEQKTSAEANLRRQAEAKLSERRKKTGPLPTMDADVRRLVHELEVQQIELEMQNEELMQARAETEAALRQYTNLYDFSPVGYFTLARNGTIIQVNLAGASLLGVERGILLNRRFGQFVVDEYRSEFIDFLDKIFECKDKESLEIELQINGQVAFCVYIEASCSEGGDECRAVVIDITERKHAAALAEKVANDWQNTFDATTDCVWLLDKDQRVVRANKASESLFKQPREEIIGKYCWEIVHGTSHPIPECPLERMKNSLQRENMELQIDDRWFNVAVDPIVDQTGEFAGAVHIIRDISERKAAEEQIRFQANLLQAVGQAVIATDLSGKIIYWNRFAESLYGWPVDEAMGKNIMDVNVSQASKEQAIEIMERLQAGISWSGELLVQRRDGTVFPAFVTDTPVYDEQGVFAGIIGVSDDITERKKAENVLHESEEQFRRAVVDSPVPIMIHDEDDNILQLSKGWTEYSGYSIKDIPTMSDWTEKAYGSSTGTEKKYIDELFEINETVDNGEWTITAKDGSKRIWDFRATPLGKNSRGKRLLHSMAVDITERKQAEEGITKAKLLLEETGRMAKIGGWELDLITMEPYFTDETFQIYELQPPTPPKLEDGINFYAPESQPLIKKAVQEAIDEQKPYDLELSFITAKGRNIWVQAQGRVHVKDGTPVRLYGTLQDITERKAMETKIINRVKELEILNRVSIALRAATKEDQLLAIILEETLFGLDAEHGSINLLDPATGTLHKTIARGWLSEFTETPIQPGDGVFGTVFKTGEVYLSKDFSTDPLTIDNVRSKLPPGWGGVCIPLRSPDQSLGILLVSIPANREFSEDKLRLLNTLAEMSGSALQRMKSNSEIQRRMDQLQALHKIDQAITSSFDLNSILSLLLSQVLIHLEVSAACVLLFNPHLRTLEYVAGKGFSTDVVKHANIRIGEDFAGRVALERSAIRISDKTIENHASGLKTVFAREGFSSYIGIPLISKGNLIGVLEVFDRNSFPDDLNWDEFLNALANQAAIAIDEIQLFETLQRSNMELTLAYDDTIEGWSRAMDLRDKETENHTKRVTELAMALSKMLGLSEEQLGHVRRGALLHDIGKLGVPDQILLKPGKLTEEEWVLMRQHPQLSYDLLRPIDYLAPALDIPYCHHEKWDGTGYPNGLKAEQIPITARVFAVVDVWDALTSDRPYRPAWSVEKALEYIKANSGTHFDPKIVEAFLTLIDERKNELKA